MVGEPDRPHLALCNQLSHRTDRLLDRNAGIGIVQLKDIDVVGSQPLQACLEVSAHGVGRSVLAPCAVGELDRPALGQDRDLIATPRDRLPDDLLGASQP